MFHRLVWVGLFLCLVACTHLEERPPLGGDGSFLGDAELRERYLLEQNIRCVDSVRDFTGVEVGAFSKERAFGPPLGGGEYMGSTDVFVLGRNQSAVFFLMGISLLDGPGIDFKVFENGFRVRDTDNYFLEYATVELSYDLVTWYGFPHQEYSGAANSPEGKNKLVGINPVWANYKTNPDLPIRSPLAGGDAFDLAEARRIVSWGDGNPHTWQWDENNSISQIRYIRITDQYQYFPPADIHLGNGVDIDAICLFHFEELW